MLSHLHRHPVVKLIPDQIHAVTATCTLCMMLYAETTGATFPVIRVAWDGEKCDFCITSAAAITGNRWCRLSTGYFPRLLTEIVKTWGGGVKIRYASWKWVHLYILTSGIRPPPELILRRRFSSY